MLCPANAPNHEFSCSFNSAESFPSFRAGEGSEGTVSAFAINRAGGQLTLLNTVHSGGAGPTYLSIHPSGRFVLVANYFGGSVAVLVMDGPTSNPPPARDRSVAADCRCYRRWSAWRRWRNGCRRVDSRRKNPRCFAVFGGGRRPAMARTRELGYVEDSSPTCASPSSPRLRTKRTAK